MSPAMSPPRFRVRTLMLAVACVAAWLGLSRVHLALGAAILMGIEVACLILVQKQYLRIRGADRARRLTAAERACLLALGAAIGAAFGPLFGATLAISQL